MEICQLPVLNDNYIYLLHDTDKDVTAVVDPAIATPVLNLLAERNWRLDYILNTHHHSDHVGANLELNRATGCHIIGAEKDQQRIPGIDQMVVEGDQFFIGKHQATVLEVPGHTSAHIAYWFNNDDLLFCGDTLFSLGCGRLFEGTPQQMWHSLQKIRNLPDQTQIYCTHEYTETNGRFALQLEPENRMLQNTMKAILQKRSQGLPTIPSSLGVEREVNPFLRVDNPVFQKAVGMNNTDPVSVFASIRQQKDKFRG
ncbi:MAG: hydroxyacylglutathione hydrolase [Methylococcales bacterium]